LQARAVTSLIFIWHLGYHDIVKRFLFALVALALLIVGAREFAIAQTDQGQRRKAFQASKQLVDLGDLADAVELLEPLADAGDEMALYTIGVLYGTGGGWRFGDRCADWLYR